MSQIVKLTLLLSLLGFGIQSSYAQNRAEDRMVDDIIVNAEGRINIRLSGDAVNPAGCPNSALVIETSVDARREWLALLLTAQASGGLVTVVVAPTNGDCANNGGNPRVLNVQSV